MLSKSNVDEMAVESSDNVVKNIVAGFARFKRL
jgi:hypothetical protein